jgi:lipopolysaccharide transport system permease protein
VQRVATLTAKFIRRDLRSRFAGSLSGGLWALIQPLLQLAIYAFVFVEVFKARLPGANAPEFVAFIAVAMWPWFAFAEAIQRSATAIQDNAALIGKVALPREVLVVASVASSFLIHLGGFVAVVVILALAGKGVVLAGLPLSILLYVPLFALALGLALICASVQVFVRDLAQALGQFLTIMMFATPILYDSAMLPERYRALLPFNPFTFYAESFHALLLNLGTVAPLSVGIALAVAALVLAIGHGVFRRLDAHFEDFL